MIGDTPASVSNLQDAEKSRRLSLEGLQLLAASDLANTTLDACYQATDPSTTIKMTETKLPDDAQKPRLENTAHPNEGADQADVQSAPLNVFPLFEIIDDFVAQNPVLQEVTISRETRWCLVSDGEHRVDREDRDLDFMYWRSRPVTEYFEHLLQQIDDLDGQDHAVLVIEDMNDEMYQLLCARYPGSLAIAFLAQHVLRLADLRCSIDSDDGKMDRLANAYFALVDHIQGMISQKSFGISNEHFRGHHIDGSIGTLFDSTASTGFGRQSGYRWEYFKKDGNSNTWRKTTTRVSLCSLTDKLNLVLVDAGRPDILIEMSLKMGGAPDILSWIQAPLPALNINYVSFSPMHFVLSLFSHYTVQSVFELPDTAAIDCLFATSVCQEAVAVLETTFLETRQRATRLSNDEAFKMLTNLRRHITTAHEKVSTTRVSVDVVVSQLVRELASRKAKGEEGTEAETLWNKHSDAVYTVDSRNADDDKLQTTLEELDDKIRDIIAALNDEIQIVIGSVQLEDAKAMRQQADLTMRLTESTMQQTKIAMRQTKWTVALALLAALYLPMTLVTGIYGMNIKEISEDKGPRWWWVFVTWVLTVGVTVGLFGRYAFVEWRWYQEEASKNEVASMQNSTGRGSGEKSHGIVTVADDEATGTGCPPAVRVKPHWRRRPKTAQSQAEETTV